MSSPWYALNLKSDSTRVRLCERKTDLISERAFSRLVCDGYVVDGIRISLAICDDAPREDFSPRQRHTLKEFAVRIIFDC